MTGLRRWVGKRKIFGWIAVRRAIPAEKGEHIRMPYSVAKIVSISPGAMPPFTLETHTINAKLNLPILPKGVFWRGRSSVSFAECHTDSFKENILCQNISPKNIYSLVDSEEGWEGGFYDSG